MEERARFVLEANHSLEPFESLCARYGISRKTGYKWLRRYDDGGLDALRDLSRRPRSSPHATPEAVVELLLDARRTHQTWGPRKLIAWLDRKHPDLRFPAPGTVGLLLKRHGLVKPRRRVRRIPPYGFPLTDPEGPGDVFCADFKGQFRLGNRKYCYPLTMTDQDSRYLLCCDALESTRSELTLPIFERVFREHGLPLYMRTDNGAPFSSRALAGLSKLGVWLIKLGVTPERIEVGKPQQNGRHERMHRTLKAETTRPPAATMKAQQRVFDRFRGEYNDDRPHEAQQVLEDLTAEFEGSWISDGMAVLAL